MFFMIFGFLFHLIFFYIFSAVAFYFSRFSFYLFLSLLFLFFVLPLSLCACGLFHACISWLCHLFILFLSCIPQPCQSLCISHSINVIVSASMLVSAGMSPMVIHDSFSAQIRWGTISKTFFSKSGRTKLFLNIKIYLLARIFLKFRAICRCPIGFIHFVTYFLCTYNSPTDFPQQPDTGTPQISNFS